MSKISVKGSEINVLNIENNDYISLTDMLRAKDGDFFISDWLRNRNTVEFLGIWEQIHNPNFNYGEFATIRSSAGLNSYKISIKEWVQKTNAIGLQAKAGRYGGTYAHKDIAFEFGMWISPEFKIYLIKEFDRLKQDEQRQLGWDIKRNLAKINYRIHTDAIQENLVPDDYNVPIKLDTKIVNHRELWYDKNKTRRPHVYEFIQEGLDCENCCDYDWHRAVRHMLDGLSTVEELKSRMEQGYTAIDNVSHSDKWHEAIHDKNWKWVVYQRLQDEVQDACMDIEAMKAAKSAGQTAVQAEMLAMAKQRNANAEKLNMLYKSIPYSNGTPSQQEKWDAEYKQLLARHKQNVTAAV